MYFIFDSWKIISQVSEFWVNSSFFPVLEKCCATSFWLPWFLWKIHCHLNCFALFIRCHISCCFWDVLSLNLQLSEVWLWWFLVWISLRLFIQSFAQISKSMYVFFHIWKTFSLSFFSIFEKCSAIISPSTFFGADLFLCFLDSSDTNIISFVIVLQLFVALFTFFGLFSRCCLAWVIPILSSTSLILSCCPLYSAVKVFKTFNDCIFKNSEISKWVFFIYSVSLLRLLAASGVHSWVLKYFYDCCFKIPAWFQHLCHLDVDVCWLSFLFQVKVFPDSWSDM